MKNADHSNGVSAAMMDAGAEALIQAGYRGIGIPTAGTQPVVLDSPSAYGIALALAFPAMLDKAESGSRDTLSHPGPIGSANLDEWKALAPSERARTILHSAPAHLLGIAAMINRLEMGWQDDRYDALSFLADALTALARQMERAAALQRRERQQQIDRQNAAIERMNADARATRAKQRPKRRAKKPVSRSAAS